MSDLHRPYFEASFLARLVRDPSYGGDRTAVASMFVEFVEAIGDGDEGSVRFGSFPVKAFGQAAELMKQDKLCEGDYIELRGATLTSQKKFKNGEEVKDADGKSVFEMVFLIDDRVGEYAAVYGKQDVDEPEKPKRETTERRGGAARGGARRASGRDSERGRDERSGGDGERGDDRGRATSRRDDDRGSDRGRSSGGRRGRA